MNFYRRTGELIFGTRLKRISDRFLMDISRVYKHLKIDFEMSWFPLFYLLDEKGGLTVTEIAGELEITHSAVSQLVGALERKGLLHFINDTSHRRRRQVYFTPKGLDLIRVLKPIWDSILRCMRGMLEEGENSAYLLAALEEVEDAMKNPGIYERVLADLEKTRLGEPEVVDYDASCKTSFNDLILRWIIENREDAPLEADVINNPGGMIERDGNLILMAKLKKKCIGILAMRIQENKEEADILCFIIDKKWKNHRIGKRLMQEGLERLRNSGVLKIGIRLNRRRTGTMRILKGAGFLLKNISVTKDSRSGNQNIIKLERDLNA
ncbi:MAG: bifunctional helix-turn-helix transcriptional regulator/GNAT family N-acetyltransferase [Candidatus Aminicenantes bacterium]|nr:bifunctional helix-turn-helix transcriptional regulator/GNAT family N-acetyltransferase [Candidatus Aminicenantes bacterium]